MCISIVTYSLLTLDNHSWCRQLLGGLNDIHSITPPEGVCCHVRITCQGSETCKLSFKLVLQSTWLVLRHDSYIELCVCVEQVVTILVKLQQYQVVSYFFPPPS